MRIGLLVLTCLSWTLAHAADTYPNRPIRYILPVAPGGGSDITARTLVPKLVEALGQQVIIDNRPGAGGVVGMSIAARTTPDGYTIVQGSIGPVAVDASLHSKMPYDTSRDFTPIARLVSALNILVVHPSMPVRTVKDLINYAKKNPDKLNFGSSGLGHADHLAGEIFKSMTGVRMQHIAYKGGAPAMTELLGANIELIFSTVSTAVTFIQSGRVRAIAVTSEKRVSLYPDIPTVAESGLPGFVVDNWYSVLGPRDMPKPIRNSTRRWHNLMSESDSRVSVFSRFRSRRRKLSATTSNPRPRNMRAWSRKRGYARTEAKTDYLSPAPVSHS